MMYKYIWLSELCNVDFFFGACDLEWDEDSVCLKYLKHLALCVEESIDVQLMMGLFFGDSDLAAIEMMMMMIHIDTFRM